MKYKMSGYQDGKMPISLMFNENEDILEKLRHDHPNKSFEAVDGPVFEVSGESYPVASAVSRKSRRYSISPGMSEKEGDAQGKEDLIDLFIEELSEEIGRIDRAMFYLYSLSAYFDCHEDTFEPMLFFVVRMRDL